MLTKVYFSDFLRTLQEFQLKQHEGYLRVFSRLFKRVDTDNDGIINEQEFLRLMEREIGQTIPINKEDITYFLQVLDPFNT